MPLDPSIIMKVQTPDDMRSNALSNQYKQGMVRQQENTDQSQQLTMALKRTELVNKLLSTVVDQPSLDQALQQAQAAGIDTKNVNPIYNPAEIERHKNALLSAHDQMLKMLYSTGKLGPKNSVKQPMVSPQPPAANNSYEGLPEPSGKGLDPTSMPPLPNNLLKPTGVTSQPLGSIPAPMSGNDIAVQPSVVKPEDLFGSAMLPPVTGKPLPVEKKIKRELPAKATSFERQSYKAMEYRDRLDAGEKLTNAEQDDYEALKQKLGLSKPLGTDQAGRVGYLTTALESEKDTRAILESLDLQNPVTATRWSMGIGKEGEAKIKVNESIEGLLRAMSGAGVPETEVSRYRGLYSPNVSDSPQRVMFKYNDLIKTARNQIKANIMHKIKDSEFEDKFNISLSDKPSESGKASKAKNFNHMWGE